MTPTQLKKVIENHNRVINIPNRLSVTEMIYLVEDLLVEEIKYLEEKEPCATKTIAETKRAREIVRDLYHSIDGMDTNELVKERIWN